MLTLLLEKVIFGGEHMIVVDIVVSTAVRLFGNIVLNAARCSSSC